MIRRPPRSSFFFNDTATTEIYTLSLHDALPICIGEKAPAFKREPEGRHEGASGDTCAPDQGAGRDDRPVGRSEEHTSELQSRQYLVCRLLLEKKQIYRVPSSY